MRKPIVFLVTALLAAVGLLFLRTFQIEGIDQVRVRPRGAGGDAVHTEAGSAVPSPRKDTIRIATFHVHALGETKASKPHVMDLLARIVRRFDVVALQGIRARSQDVIPQLVDLVNLTGTSYDYVLSQRLGPSTALEQYAFVYDRAAVEVDRDQLYTVDDPDDLLLREPYVAFFRTRGPAADQAFTFTLVNVHVDPDQRAQELNMLDDVVHAVRADGRNEDDVLILGNFQADDQGLGQLGEVSHVVCAVSHLPTDTPGTQQSTNLVMSQLATTEFTGRAGVFDFMREYNLTLDAALEVSDQMPVWAEFSVYEGGRPGRVATGDRSPSR